MSRFDSARFSATPYKALLVVTAVLMCGFDRSIPAADYDVFFSTNGPIAGPRNDGILRFSSDGTFEQFLDTPDFDTIFSLGTDGANLIATASVGNFARIDRYSTSGQFLGNIATLGPLNGFVFDMEQDSLGNYFVLDINSNAYRFRSNGTLDRIFGTASFDLELDSQGRVYATDRNRIRRYDNLGNFQLEIPTSFFFAGEIEIDQSTGLLYHMNQQGTELSVFDTTPDVPVLLNTYAVPTSPDGLALHFNPASHSIFVAADGPAAEISTSGAFIRWFIHPTVDNLLDVVTVPVPEPGCIAIIGCLVLAGLTGRSHSRCIRRTP